MDVNKDVLSPVLLFLQKLLGSQLWIIPLAVAIASWIVWKYSHVSLWLLYIAIIFTLITVLLLGVRMSSYMYNLWEKYRVHRKFKQEQKVRLLQQLQNKEKQEKEEVTYIWKYVAHINSDIISIASYLLELECHDGNQHLRFITRPNNYKENQVVESLINASHYFSIPKMYSHSTYNLINIENVNNGIYFEIHPYLYRLLKQYKENRIWVKI